MAITINPYTSVIDAFNDTGTLVYRNTGTVTTVTNLKGSDNIAWASTTGTVTYDSNIAIRTPHFTGMYGTVEEEPIEEFENEGEVQMKSIKDMLKI